MATTVKAGDLAIWAGYARRPQQVLVKKVTDKRVTFYKNPEWALDAENIRRDMHAQFEKSIAYAEEHVDHFNAAGEPRFEHVINAYNRSIEHQRELIAELATKTPKELQDRYLRVSCTIHERVFKGTM